MNKFLKNLKKNKKKSRFPLEWRLLKIQEPACQSLAERKFERRRRRYASVRPVHLTASRRPAAAAANCFDAIVEWRSLRSRVGRRRDAAANCPARRRVIELLAVDVRHHQRPIPECHVNLASKTKPLLAGVSACSLIIKVNSNFSPKR